MFEKLLAWWIGKRPCDGCGKPLGNGPRYHVYDRKSKRRNQYHTECWEEK